MRGLNHKKAMLGESFAKNHGNLYDGTERTVSVVIPFYNRVSFLERALQSVYVQDYRPLELILVDNNSTDGSRLVAEKFAELHREHDFSVRIFAETKRGAAAARNKGLSVARGEYLFFFDSDDGMSPDYLSWAVRTINDNGAEAVVTPTLMCWQDGRTVQRSYLSHLTVEGQILTGQLSTQSVFYKSTFARRLNGWNEDLLYWNDWEMGIRILLSDALISWHKDKVFHFIYQHDESITGKSYSDSFPKIMKAFKHISQMLRQDATLPHSVLFSLAMREAIMSGQLYKEKQIGQSRVCFSLTREQTFSLWERLALRVLRAYTAMGGRGAWRLALKLL